MNRLSIRALPLLAALVMTGSSPLHAYRLESSLDGKTWKPCGGHEDVKVRSPHTDLNIGSMRYLKLTLLQGTPGLWEFRVY